jgi:hypothetical protein
VVEVVRAFQYLGAWFTENWGAYKEVTHRIAVAAAVCARLNLRIWRTHVFPITVKLRVYYCLVLSILFYGLSARILPEHFENRIEIFHIRSIRKLLNCPVFMDRKTHAQA